MSLSIETVADYTIIRTDLTKINYENANNFSKETVDHIENKKPVNLAIDFTSITYISSIGISALSVIKGIAKINHCNLVLFGLSSSVLSVLEQTGLDTMFTILNNEAEVKAQFLNK